MTLGMFAALVGAATSGTLLRGDVLYVSAALYARLSPRECKWLWALALDARATVVTDVEVEPPILVRRSGHPPA